MRFNKKTTNRLKESGWYPNRRVDIKEKLEVLEQERGFITEEMRSFLLEFDGLYLNYGYENLFSFSVHERYYINSENIENNWRNGLLCEHSLFIGTFFNCELEVFITDNCKMYCYDDMQKIYEIGSYYDEGIAFICTHGLNPTNHLKNKII